MMLFTIVYGIIWSLTNDFDLLKFLIIFSIGFTGVILHTLTTIGIPILTINDRTPKESNE